MLEVLFFIPFTVLVILGFKWFIILPYKLFKYGQDGFFPYSERICDLSGVILYINVIFKLNLDNDDESYLCTIGDFALFFGKTLSFLSLPFIQKFEFGISLSNLQINISVIISMTIVFSYYLIKSSFKKLDLEIANYYYYKKEKELIEWFERNSNSILFKTLMAKYDSRFVKGIYQKWKLHEDLQQEMVVQPVKVKNINKI